MGMGGKLRRLLNSKAIAFSTSAIVCLTSTACGSLYIHSDELETLSRQSQTAFQGVVAKNNAGALVDQIEANQDMAIGLIRSLDLANAETQLNFFLDQTWEDMIEQTDAKLKNARAQAGAISRSQTTAREKLARAVEKMSGAKEASIKAEDALYAALCYSQLHIATQEFITGIVAINFNRDLDIDAQTVEGILDKKVPPFDGQGKSNCSGEGSVAKLLGLEGLTDTIRLVGTPDREAALATLFQKIPTFRKLDGELKLALRDPGLSTTILGLGYDLTRAAELRLKAEALHLQKLEALYEEEDSFNKRWVENLEASLNEEGPFSITAVAKAIRQKCPGREAESIGGALQCLSDDLIKAQEALFRADAGSENEVREKRYEARELLRNSLITITVAFENVFVLQRKAAEFRNLEATMNTARVAARSEAYLKEREAVINRGLEGLVAFHRGGIASEDVQALIGLAQTAALLVIAGD